MAEWLSHLLEESTGSRRPGRFAPPCRGTRRGSGPESGGAGRLGSHSVPVPVVVRAVASTKMGDCRPRGGCGSGSGGTHTTRSRTIGRGGALRGMARRGAFRTPQPPCGGPDSWNSRGGFRRSDLHRHAPRNDAARLERDSVVALGRHRRHPLRPGPAYRSCCRRLQDRGSQLPTAVPLRNPPTPIPGDARLASRDHRRATCSGHRIRPGPARPVVAGLRCNRYPDRHRNPGPCHNGPDSLGCCSRDNRDSANDPGSADHDSHHFRSFHDGATTDLGQRRSPHHRLARQRRRVRPPRCENRHDHRALDRCGHRRRGGVQRTSQLALRHLPRRDPRSRTMARWLRGYRQRDLRPGAEIPRGFPERR